MLERLCMAAALALAPFAAAAQARDAAPAEAPATRLETRADQIVALLNGDADPQAVFTNDFLAAVSPAQLKALRASLTAQMGAATGVALLSPRDGTRAQLHIRFERGLAKGSLAIDPAQDGKVNELLFTAVDSLAMAGDTPERIAADLAALPGKVNAWFAPLGGGPPVIAIDPQKPQALGSTFKLYVLAALAEDVKAGQRQWTDVVALDQKSYPSGQLQEWPQGAPMTLHTLAGLMISISDNTATDQLIKVLGKARILKLMKDSGHADPGANDPFLTTRELFILKSRDPAVVDRWRSGPPQERDVAIGADTPPLETIMAAFAKGPKALDIEWFASPADLARLFAHMRMTADPEAFRIMAINPSATPAIRAEWDYIGFKGGSEPGVLNLTWLLRDKAGAWHVLSLSWNDPAAEVDEGRLEGIAQRILLLPR